MVGNTDTRAKSLQNTVFLKPFLSENTEGHFWRFGCIQNRTKEEPKANSGHTFSKIGKALFHRKLITVGPTNFLGF